jgi:type II secretory pathway pseudopilin PulG
MMAHMTKLSTANVRCRASLRTAVVGLAAERYRLQHGRWPETLEALVKDGYLDAVPADPFDGQPLRWRRVPGGHLIYSVGDDGEDNAGNIRRDTPTAPGTDLGFQLWDVPARRQPPAPLAP